MRVRLGRDTDTDAEIANRPTLTLTPQYFCVSKFGTDNGIFGVRAKSSENGMRGLNS